MLENRFIADVKDRAGIWEEAVCNWLLAFCLCEAFTDGTERKITNKLFCCYDFSKIPEKEQINKIEKQKSIYLSIYPSVSLELSPCIQTYRRKMTPRIY